MGAGELAELGRTGDEGTALQGEEEERSERQTRERPTKVLARNGLVGRRCTAGLACDRDGRGKAVIRGAMPEQPLWVEAIAS